MISSAKDWDLTQLSGGGDVSNLATLHEIRVAAHRNLSPGAWNYLIGGADTEISLLRDRRALDSLDKLSEEILVSMTPVVPQGQFSYFPFLNPSSQGY
ncbi:MAG TPA: hypothetical protein DEV64_08230 [Rhodospirillaceae bacterium]|nr:hypothetical protein [Rhodospirillaceae bacterium]|tara:strand:- start:7552 stop:7845 length:294 start_codon:yes stop_codon:yes gene_type:complete